MNSLQDIRLSLDLCMKATRFTPFQHEIVWLLTYSSWHLYSDIQISLVCNWIQLAFVIFAYQLIPATMDDEMRERNLSFVLTSAISSRKRYLRQSQESFWNLSFNVSKEDKKSERQGLWGRLTCSPTSTTRTLRAEITGSELWLYLYCSIMTIEHCLHPIRSPKWTNRSWKN